MEGTWYIVAFGIALAVLGIGIVYYLVRLYLNYLSDDREMRNQDPDYVKEINGRLVLNNVETERDLV